MSLAWMQIPSEWCVGQSHDTIAVGIASGEKCCATGTALRRGAETVAEAYPPLGDPIDVGGSNSLDSMPSEMLTEIVTDQEDYVRLICIRLMSCCGHHVTITVTVATTSAVSRVRILVYYDPRYGNMQCSRLCRDGRHPSRSR